MLVQKLREFPKLADIPELVALDTETDMGTYKIKGFSIAYFVGDKIKKYYMPINNNFCWQEGFVNLPKEKCIQWLKRLISGKGIGNKRRIVFHNAAFDLIVLAELGIYIEEGQYEDTMLMHFCLNTERRHALKEIMQTEYGMDVVRFKEIDDRQDFPKYALYAANDPKYTLTIYHDMMIEFEKLPSCYKCYKEIDLPLVPSMMKINHYNNGIRIDMKLMKHYSTIINDEIYAVQTILREKLGNINLGSTKQLGPALEKCGYRLNFTKKGNYSLGEKELVKLQKQGGAVIKYIMYLRSLKQSNNTYVTGLLKFIKCVDKKNDIWVLSGYRFGQITARSRRFNCVHPNLQNQPRDPLYMKMQIAAELKEIGKLKNYRKLLDDSKIKELLKLGKEDSEISNTFEMYSVDLRKVYIPMPGKVFIDLDMSQVELRMMAFLSRDPVMTKSFNDDVDVHKDTAENLTKIVKFEVTRQDAKPFNFGLIYGLYWTTIAQNFNLHKEKAKTMYEGYFTLYKGIAKFIDYWHRRAAKTGFAVTLFGGRRNMVDVGIRDYDNFNRNKNAQNATISTVVSGSCADYMKLNMININKKFPELKILLQVHDELLFEVDEDKVDYYFEPIKEIMEHSIDFTNPTLPFKAEGAKGMSWRQAHG